MSHNADDVETNRIGSASGNYRKLKASLFPLVAGLLYILLAGLALADHNAVKAHSEELIVLKAQREFDTEAREEFRTAIKGLTDEFRAVTHDLQQDVKELLREVRR